MIYWGSYLCLGKPTLAAARQHISSPSMVVACSRDIVSCSNSNKVGILIVLVIAIRTLVIVVILVIIITVVIIGIILIVDINYVGR